MINPVVSAQLALAASASLVAAFAPPAQGRMLLVPISGGRVTETMVQNLNATPLKSGPLPGSWIVDGDRQSLAPLLSQGILVLAAPAAACITSVPGDGIHS